MQAYRSRFPLTLGVKLGMACAAVELVLLLLVLGAVYRMSTQQLDRYRDVRTTELSHLMSMAFADPLVRKNASEVIDLVDRLLDGQSDLAGIEVINLNGRSITRRTRSGAELSAPIEAEIKVGGQSYGKVRFALSQSGWADEHRRLIANTLAIGITVMFVTILLFAFIGYLLTGRLRSITECADRIADGDFRPDLPKEGDDEVGHLSKAFSVMAGALKQRFDELTAARDAAESANRAKTTFLATMSHELRTPLNAIIGLAEVASRSAGDASLREQLAKIKHSGWKLNGMVTDMLEISRIESGQRVPVEKPFALTDLALKLRNEFDSEATAKGIALEFALEPGQGETVFLGDPAGICTVLEKLIANAIKFTAVGGITVTIGARSALPEAVTVRFSVADTGIGMLPEGLKRIFNLFEQGDGSMTRRYGGTGLGLPIAQGLVTAMGGQIQVESSLGEGSTFWFDLSLRRDTMTDMP